MTMKISIIGSTGSIGKSALKVVDAFPGRFKVIGLSCNSNIDELAIQIELYKPEFVALSGDDIENSKGIDELRDKYPTIEFLFGEEGLIELTSRPVDVLLSAIVGSAGLRPTLNAIPNVKRIALANKETLVMAGEIIKQELKKYNTELVPVDSEHSAIFSLLRKEDSNNIDKIIITASGGSLRDRKADDLSSITVEEALNHPTWNMGSKITIDSATLFNKGLEVIEAHYLFDIPYSKIDVIIHPESIIHSMIETIDGSIYAHMGVTDMVYPIANAFFYPDMFKNPFEKLDLCKIGSLSFQEYDEKKFPALKICYQAGEEAGTVPAVMNAANEVAVRAFLQNEISFTDIVKVVTKSIESHTKISNPNLDEIFYSDIKAREKAETIIRGLKK